MGNHLLGAVTEHRFPPVFFRHPRLLGLVHLLMRATTLRVWYVRRAFRELLGGLQQPFTVVDAGCGCGDYLLPAARRYPACRFVGVDRAEDNVGVARAYARARGIGNAAFVHDRVETYAFPAPVDAIACVVVLYLVGDDRALLGRFFDALRPGGRLLLYESVYNRRVLPFYDAWLARFEPYDVVQQRRRVYTPEAVRQKLEDAGFEVESARYAYGTAGRLYHEVYNLSMHVLLGAHWVLYPVLVPLFAALMPLFWLLMVLDFAGRRTSGNGMLVVARRP